MLCLLNANVPMSATISMMAGPWPGLPRWILSGFDHRRFLADSDTISSVRRSTKKREEVKVCGFLAQFLKMAGLLDAEAVCEDIEEGDEFVDDEERQSDIDFIDDDGVEEDDAGIYLSSQVFEHDSRDGCAEVGAEANAVDAADYRFAIPKAITDGMRLLKDSYDKEDFWSWFENRFKIDAAFNLKCVPPELHMVKLEEACSFMLSNYPYPLLRYLAPELLPLQQLYPDK